MLTVGRLSILFRFSCCPFIVGEQKAGCFVGHCQGMWKNITEQLKVALTIFGQNRRRSRIGALFIINFYWILNKRQSETVPEDSVKIHRK